MEKIGLAAAIIVAAAISASPHRASGQQMDEMQMSSLDLGGGWRLTGMAQAFPVVTVGAPGDDDNPLHETGWYLTQPAIMTHLEGPGQRFVLHTTFNFEALTQDDGELTLGGWGEGYIDKRHPHTLLHEAMLSFNIRDVAGGSFSLSAGKGFAPFGTPDPMARPGLKYPTNHHLSQILERWTLNAVWHPSRWSIEAGIFGGDEPEGPYDFSNVESFGDSWSARVARRWGPGSGASAAWEASASVARVSELAHTSEEEHTWLLNTALRHARDVGPGHLEGLLEGSKSYLQNHEDFFSVLGEARYDWNGHQPYVRVEYATRPEYEREGVSGQDFFLYHDHDDPVGTTRWAVYTAAYAYELTRTPWSIRPFVEVQNHQIRFNSGDVTATELYGTTSVWALSVGARIFMIGGPMRMGSYGVLDPMTGMGSMDGANAMPMGG